MGVQAIKQAALLRAWTGRIAECRSSGKTVKAWCEAEGVSIKTYYYWEKRIVAEASQEVSIPPRECIKTGEIEQRFRWY